MINLEQVDRNMADALDADPDPTLLRVMRVAKKYYMGLGLTDRLTDLSQMAERLRVHEIDDDAGARLVAAATANPGWAVAGPMTEAEYEAENPPE